MAFSREELKNIGVDDEKLDDIMSLYGKNVQDLKDKVEKEQSKANEFKHESESYKKRVEEQNSQLDELNKKVNQGENLSEQIEALKQANKDKDNEHKKEMNQVKLQYEIDKELSSAGAKNNKAVMALIDNDNISFDDEDGLKGLKDQLKELKESDSYLFVDNNEGNQDTGNEDNADNNTDVQTKDYSYNAGSSKGNKGQEPSAEVAGRKAYERLFGDKTTNKED